MPNYFQIGSVFFDKKILKVFHFVCHGKQILHGVEIFEYFVSGSSNDHSCKNGGEILPSSLGGIIV